MARWLGGKGRELYEVDEGELDEVIAAARQWNRDVLPKMAEAERLWRQQCDRKVLNLTPRTPTAEDGHAATWAR